MILFPGLYTFMPRLVYPSRIFLSSLQNALRRNFSWQFCFFHEYVNRVVFQTLDARNSNEILISSLKPNQKYDVSVKACNSVGCSDYTKPIQGMAASRSGGGGSSSGGGGEALGAGGNTVPLRTMVIVPLILVGLVLLVSLLIVICRRNRDQRRNAALKKGQRQ